MTCEGIALLQMPECDIQRTKVDEEKEDEDNGNNGNDSDKDDDDK